MAIRDIGLFPGKFIGWAGSCSGEVAHFHSLDFQWEILTDPAYHRKIVITDPVYVEDKIPLPEESQSFMPHLSGIVFLGAIRRPSLNYTNRGLSDYLRANRVAGFLPDKRNLLFDLLRIAPASVAGLGRDPEEAVSASAQPGSIKVEDLKNLAAPLEYLWDLLPGEKAREKFNVAVWDFGTSYKLLQSLRTKGCRVRVMPPSSFPEDIVALHPHGVIISGNVLSEEARAGIIPGVERLIGIRPLLGVGGGAVTLATALDAETVKLEEPHFGTAIPVEEIESGEIAATCQNHTHSISHKSMEESGAEITHINVCDDSVEAYRIDDYKIIGTLYHESFMERRSFLDRFLELLI